MRIGILTLHSQTNYGGVLQAYALQSILESLGHEVVVIDRWMDEGNSLLNGVFSCRSPGAWMKFFCRGLLGFGDFAHLIRCRRTKRMLPNLLHLSKYSFCHWKDAPADLGIDLLVVGSDQVWNPGALCNGQVYLLKGSPKIPAISYAASFGVKSLPREWEDAYRDGLARFRSISVREKEGCAIVSALGFSATHVVDPVFLADPKIWDRFRPLARRRKGKKLVCYFIHEPMGKVLADLRHFSAKNKCDVEVFLGGPWQEIPRRPKEWLSIFSGVFRALLIPRIHLRAIATPNEFVGEIAAADWVVTDSFHGLMFSTVFRKNVRILKPRRNSADGGFSRLSEFVSSHLRGKALSEGLDDALRSLFNDLPVRYDLDGLVRAKEVSSLWLHNAMSVQSCNQY